MDDFLLSHVRSYTQSDPDTFSNVGFYFIFRSNIDRLTFSTNHLPHTKRFLSDLLFWVQGVIEKCKKSRDEEKTALSSYLDHLEGSLHYESILEKLSSSQRAHFCDLLRYVERVEGKRKEIFPYQGDAGVFAELKIFLRLQDILKKGFIC
jgi:hypothetical protein